MVNSVLRRIWRKLYFNFCVHYKPVPTLRLGSEYGGWTIPADIIDSQSICYLAGAGLDISFDLELASHYKCQVHVFDPTPRAEQHYQDLKEHVDSSRMMRYKEGIYSISKEDFKYVSYHSLGLWDKDDVVKFYFPKNREHVSHSVVNLQQTDEFFEAKVVTLKSAMSQLNHSTIDLLKLNIAGAEYEVIPTVLDSQTEIPIFCVRYEELHHAKDLGFMNRIHRSMKMVKNAGYKIVAIDSCYNITFLKS